MARPKHEQPTPAELEVLQVLWDQGPLTVRQVMAELNRTRRRAYTTVMSLMNVMVEKDLLRQKPKGRAFEYWARVSRDKVQSRMGSELLGRAFDGSASALVAHLLEGAKPAPEELDDIRKAIAEYTHRKGAM